MGAGHIAEQSVTNKRTKHIDLRYHFVREEIQEFKNFDLKYVITTENTSDIFTKPLDKTLFEKHGTFSAEFQLSILYRCRVSERRLLLKTWLR
jgi:hypothetical protein